MARRVNLHLDEEFADEIERHKPKSLALSAFCALLIEQALDKTGLPPLQPPVRGANKCSSASVESADECESPVSGGRGGPGGEIPPDLSSYAPLIKEFWRLKKGSKGETAWNLLMGQLGKIHAKYGAQVVEEQLQLGINGKFTSITLSNYEKFGRNGPTPTQPEVRHPASQVFTAKDFEGPATNPALEGFL